MSTKLRRNIVVLTMTATSGLILPWSAANARKPEAEPARAPAAQPNRGAAEAEQRAAQEQERKAQMDEARAQQEQQRQQHDQAMKQAQEERTQQEQALRQQEQQSRKAQQDAQRAQQEQARAQEEAQRQAAQRTQPQERNQPAQRDQPQRNNAAMMEHEGGPTAREGNPNLAAAGQPHGEHGNPNAAFVKDRSGNPVFTRSATPAQISAPRLPLEKAVAMPVLAPNASPADREHLEQVQGNLQQHMMAVAAADAPSNFHSMPNFAQQAYFNNYQTMINNQQLIINRQNTFINPLSQNQWPVWYQPQPGWQFCNGFTLGNSIVADLNWLRWGWHPYYGPQPEGFVCSSNYVPTPWIYLPAYGTWRQPGVNSYASYGPPYDYTGPISVEMFEPRRVNVDVPFGGFLPQQVINVVYMYNAYYYPDYGRYGYMNRHGNWIWLNLGTSPF